VTSILTRCNRSTLCARQLAFLNTALSLTIELSKDDSMAQVWVVEMLKARLQIMLGLKT